MTVKAVPSNLSRASIAGTVGLIAALWIVSDAGYYLLPPLFGLSASYNTRPVSSALYYAAWIAVTLVLFRRQYRAWNTWDLRPRVLVVATLIAAGFAVYLLVVPPVLPAVTWHETWPAPDILLADPWYFLPKSIDILFQQLLIVALVLTLTAHQHNLRRTSILCAMLFGGAHLLLALGGLPLIYVARFTIFAALFGFVFPALIVKVKNGLIWSYALHWTYYAATLVTAHLLSPYAD